MNDRAAVWPLSVRLIHWASAALIVGTLGLGAYMVELVQDPARRFDLTQTHKSIGVAMLALTAARLCLRMLTASPKPLPAAPPVRLAAKANHVSLYVLLLLMPLSGWLMATTTPIRVPTVVFGLFTLPYPLQPDLPTYKLAHALHVVAAIVLAAVVALHVAAALVHALWWRDGILVRMWRKPRAFTQGGLRRPGRCRFPHDADPAQPTIGANPPRAPMVGCGGSNAATDLPHTGRLNPPWEQPAHVSEDPTTGFSPRTERRYTWSNPQGRGFTGNHSR